MFKVLLAFALLAAASTAASAKTVSLDSDGSPVASVTLPDAWDVDAADGGFEAVTPDQELYVSGEIVAAEDLKAAGQDTARTLAEQKITLKQDTRKVAPLTIAGMPGASISWDATDENGPTQVHMVVLKAKPNEEVVLLRWGDEKAEKAHAAEIDAILKSTVPAK